MAVDLTKFGLVEADPAAPAGGPIDLTKFGLVEAPITGSLPLAPPEPAPWVTPPPKPPDMDAPPPMIAGSQWPDDSRVPNDPAMEAYLGGAIDRNRQEVDAIVRDEAIRQEAYWAEPIEKWTPQKWIEYREQLPLPMTADVMADPLMAERYRVINELALGKPLKDRELPEARQKGIDRELAEMRAKGIDDPVEYMAQRGAKIGPQGMAGRLNEAFSEGVMEGGRNLTTDMIQGIADFVLGADNPVSQTLGGQSETNRRSLRKGWREKVEQEKDKEALIGAFPSQAVRLTAETMGQMAPSMIGGGVARAAGASSARQGAVVIGSMSAGAGVNVYNQKRAEGWDRDKAFYYGAVTGLIEALTERVGAGVAKRFGFANLESMFTKAGMETVRDIIKKGGVQSILKVAGGAITEGGEELAADVLNDIKNVMAKQPLDESDPVMTFTVGVLAGLAGHVPAVSLYLMRPNKKNAKAAGVDENLDHEAVAAAATEAAEAAADTPQYPPEVVAAMTPEERAAQGIAEPEQQPAAGAVSAPPIPQDAVAADMEAPPSTTPASEAGATELPPSTPDPDVDRVQAIVDKAVPEAKAKVGRVGDQGRYLVSFPNGKSVEVEEIEKFELSEADVVRALSDYGLDDTPENRQHFTGDKIRGSFQLRLKDGGAVDSVGLIRLKAGLGDDAPALLRHELVHMLRQTGMLNDQQWGALTDLLGVKNATPKQQEEAVAAHIQQDKTFADTIGKWIDQLLSLVGVPPKEAKRLERALRSGKLFAAPAATTTPTKESTDEIEVEAQGEGEGEKAVSQVEGEKEGLLTPASEPPAVAAPAAPPSKPEWLNSLTEPQQAKVFAAMAKLRVRSDRMYDDARFMSGAKGVPVGSGAFDPLLTAEAISSVLREISRGKTPEQAAEIAKKEAREAIAKHNSRRPNDVNWARWEGAADSTIDSVVRDLVRAKEAVEPAAKPAEEKGPTEILDQVKKDGLAKINAMSDADLEAAIKAAMEEDDAAPEEKVVEPPRYFTPEAIKEAETQPSKSREKLVWMKPSNFLAVAEDLAEGPSAEKTKAVADLIESGTPFNSLPRLGFTHDGQGKATVTSHEGRHRALALQKRGVTLMPVILTSTGTPQGPGIRWGEQKDRNSFDFYKGVWPKTLHQEDGGKGVITFPVPDIRAKGPTPQISPPKGPLKGNSPSAGKAWLADALSRRPKGVDSPAASAEWIRRGFSNDQYQRYLDDAGLTLDEAVAQLLTPAKKSLRKPTETAEFKRWFGKSKVTDAEGNPLVVYHGTSKDFDEFSESGQRDAGQYGQGYYATNKAAGAEMYSGALRGETGANIMPLYLSLQNPLIATGEAIYKRYPDLGGKALSDAIQRDGYDGIIVESGDKFSEIVDYVAFSPNQLKSATGNSGAFNPNSPKLTDKPTANLQSPKKSLRKPPEKKPIAEKAQEARDDLAAAWDDLKKAIRDSGTTLPSTGVDPRIVDAAVKVAMKAVRAGTLTFAEYVSMAVDNLGRDLTLAIGGSLERAWKAVGKITNGAVDAPRPVSEVIQELENETQAPVSPDLADEGVSDGAGQPGADAPAAPDRTPEKRPAKGKPGTKGDRPLQDDGATPPGPPERAGGESTGDGAGGVSDAGQPELAGGKAPDGGGAAPAGGVSAADAASLNLLNHAIDPTDDLAVPSTTESLKRNLAALRMLKKLEDEGRAATPAEKKTLAQFTGWGGLSQAFDRIKGDAMESERKWGRDEKWENKWGKAYKELKTLMTPEEWETARASTENAHYTSKDVIQKMWQLVDRLGFTGGRVLEPGAGIGHFAGLVPSKFRHASKFVMVERDSFSSRMLKKLYPEADVHDVPMEEFRVAPGAVDLVIGNVPFAQGDVADSFARYNLGLNLHNYFIARSLDAVRPGGLVVLISTHHTLDSQADQRALLNSKAQLIGAIRLPRTTFEDNAKTEVVTDILVLRRPIAGEPVGAVVHHPFLATKDIKLVKPSDKKETDQRVNQYFVDNPDMVLGKHALSGTQYRADSYTVEPHKAPLSEQIAAAIENFPSGVYGGQQAAGDIVEAAPEEEAREGHLKLDGKKLMMAVGGKFIEITKGMDPLPGYRKYLFGATGIERAADYIALRDAYKDLRRIMLDPASSDADVAAGQKRLGKVYDDYVKKHEEVNRGKTALFENDPEYYRVLSLEVEKTKLDEKGKRLIYTYSKAAVFTKRTLGPRLAPTKADTIKDALWISLGYKGMVDVDYIAQLMGIEPIQVIDELGKEGLAFRNPETLDFQLRDRYLSGNVRKKLRAAKLAVEDGDLSYQANVDALEKVQPEPVGITKISFRIGTDWIPQEVVTHFARQLTNRPVKVSYDQANDHWSVSNVSFGREWAVDSEVLDHRGEPLVTLDGREILEDLLNLQIPKVVYYVASKDEVDSKGNPKQIKHIDEKATANSKAVVQRMQDAFQKYVYSTPESAATMEAIYNEVKNSFVDAKNDGSHLELPGADPNIKLRPYQKNAIWRMLQYGYGLLAHAVGAGKTYTMIGAAMEMRRLGLAKRPVLVVQNATLGQFAASFMRMYPNANVLVASKDDLAFKNRQLFLNRVTSGDWDAIVLAQSTFDGLAPSPQNAIDWLREQITLLEDAIAEQGGDKGRNSTPTVKELVRSLRKLREKLTKQLNALDHDKNTLYFDDLHADALFIDEAHAYKKPHFVTKLENLVGLNKQTSQRGISTMVKVRSIQRKMGGKNVFFATGTPITNTLGELWHMVNFINPRLNEEYGISTFDRFVSSFAVINQIRDQNAGGQWIFRDAIVRFVNGPELMHYLRESWDILSPDDLRAYMDESEEGGLPKITGDKPQAVTVAQTPGNKKFSRFISQVYAKFKALPAKDRRDMSYIPAVAYGAGRAASLDIRLVFPKAKEEANSKLDVAVENMMREYSASLDNKGTQLVFSDTFNPRSMATLYDFMRGEPVDLDVDEVEDRPSQVGTIAEDEDGEGGEKEQEEKERKAEVKAFLFQDLKRKLMAAGVPESEIAIVAEANTDAKRMAMFDRVNSGDIRFLLGSSSKMGVGVNVQQKIVALHHLDSPWLPADYEQRNGRAIRWGNENKYVTLYRYAMKGTLDGAIFAKMIRKAKFIWQVMSGKLEGREFDDPASEMTLSFEEQLAAILDDPLLFEQMDVERDKRELELQREAHHDAIARNRTYIQNYKEEVDRLKNTTTPHQKALFEEAKAAVTEKPTLELQGKTYEDMKEMNAALAAFIEGHRAEIDKLVRDKKLDQWRPNRYMALTQNQIPYLSEPFKVSGFTAHVTAGTWQEVKDKDKGPEWFSAATVVVALDSQPTVNVYDGGAETAFGLAQSLLELPARIGKGVDESLERIAKREAEIAELQGLVDRVWPDQEKLDKLTERLTVISAELVRKSEEAAAADKAIAEQRQRERERRQREGGGGEAAIRDPSLPGAAARQPNTTPLSPAGQFALKLQSVPTPELVELARQLLGGKLPQVSRRLRSALGVFKHMDGLTSNMQILINPTIARNEYELAAVLAHEIGHAIDYLPDATMSRGNMLGRIKSLRKFMSNYARGVMASDKSIRKELVNLTIWWSGPFDKGSERYQKYRKSARELYAEALSVFLNSPADLAARAPKFWQGFADHINTKPDVLQAYLELQAILNGTPAELAADRSARIRAMFEKGDEAIKAAQMAEAAARKSTVESVKQHLEQHLLESATPVKRRLQKAIKGGATFNDAENAYYILDEISSIDSPVHAMLAKIQREVYKPLIDQGLTRDDMGEYLFLKRVVNERNEIINPLGFTKGTAGPQIGQLQARLGPRKFDILHRHMQKWHRIIFESVERAVEGDVYNTEMFSQLIAPNKDNYATFAVTHYLEKDAHIPAGIFKQVGTFSEVANPLDATHMKIITLNRLTELNVAKRAVINLLKAHFPGEITPAPIAFGESEPRSAAKAGFEHLLVLENGKLRAYEVPAEIAASFLRHDVGGLAKIGKLVESAVYKIFHPLFVTWNPGFMAQNIFRDLRRTYINLSSIGSALNQEMVEELTQKYIHQGRTKDEAKKLAVEMAKPMKITFADVIRAYKKAMGPAKRRAQGLDDPLIDRMMAARALDIPFVSVDPESLGGEVTIGGKRVVKGPTEALLERHGLTEKQAADDRSMARKFLSWLGGKAEGTGVFLETLPKVAAEELLSKRKVEPRRKSYYIRKYVGTPDYKQRGLSTALTNSIYMYSKVKFNGLQADLGLATDSKTAAGWWWRRMLWTIMPTTMFKIAAYGFLGATIKAAYERVPRYYLNNYDVIPLGYLLKGDDDDDRGKTVFLTISQDDTGRGIKALWAHLMDLGAEQLGIETGASGTEEIIHDLYGDLADMVVPTTNPMFDLASKWSQYARGINPYDSHFGTQIIPRTEWDAKGLPAFKKMLSWSFDKLGILSTVSKGLTGPTLGSPFESGEEATIETLVRLVPGLSRMIRISDRGITEREWARADADDREAAYFRYNLAEPVRRAVRELTWLQRKGSHTPLTETEHEHKLLLAKFYSQAYLPLLDRIKEGDETAAAELEAAAGDITARYMPLVAEDQAKLWILEVDKPQRGDNLEERTAQWEEAHAAAGRWLEKHKGFPGVRESIDSVKASESFQEAVKATRTRPPVGENMPKRKLGESQAEYQKRLDAWSNRLPRHQERVRRGLSAKSRAQSL